MTIIGYAIAYVVHIEIVPPTCMRSEQHDISGLPFSHDVKPWMLYTAPGWFESGKNPSQSL